MDRFSSIPRRFARANTIATVLTFALTIAVCPTVSAQARLTPVTSEPESSAGWAVAVSGDRILVGAPVDSELGPGAGAAYVYVFDGSSWTQEAKLTASNGGAGHDFGTSVALDGNRAIVGAPGELFDSGSAYIFEFDGSSWSESAQIYDQAGAPNLRFGYSVALDGDRVLVGLPGDFEFDGYRGSAYVFDFNGSSWTETNQLRIIDGGKGNPLGTDVSLDGNRALVGAGSVLPTNSYGGDYAAYVFTFDGTTWDAGVKLQAADPSNDNAFGTSVSLDGDRALIGTYAEGNASIFTFDGSNWTETATLALAPETYSFGFGISVELDGDRALIGNYNDEADDGGNPGAAYVFEFNGTAWNQSARIVVDGGTDGDRFGHAVALEGDRAVIGAPQEDGANGSARVFDLGGSGWEEQATFTPTGGAEFAGDMFGGAVSIDGDRALVGAPQDGGGRGSAYTFVRDGMSWTQESFFVAEGAERSFGTAVSLDGDRALIGAPEDNGYKGAAYTFTFNGTTWSQEAELDLPDDARRFATDVSLDGNRALIGEPESGDDGRAHLYVYDGSAWTKQATLEPSSGTDFGFGRAVSLEGDRALIGSPEDEAAFVFEFDGTSWTEVAILEPSLSSAENDFGQSVSLSGDRALIGVPFDEAAYFFAFDGTAWVEDGLFTPNDVAYYGFGYVVSLDGDRALVGGYENAFALEFNGTEWVEQVALKSPAGDFAASFGRAVALSGDLALIGDPREKLTEDDFTGSGGVYSFDLSDDNVATESDASMKRALVVSVYPNPARDMAALALNIGESGEVRADVFDLLGRRITTIHDGPLAAGSYDFHLDASALPAGHYFVRVVTATSVQTQRLAIAR